jgi:hypothetical protein
MNSHHRKMASTIPARQSRSLMRIEVKRLDGDGKYETVITRDDGVSFRIQGVGHAFAIPHDLAHYLVEKALSIEDGFWGNVACGAVFPSMTHLAGRRKPKASERSITLLKANARALIEAEVLVRIFNDTIEQGHAENSTVLAGRLQDRLASPTTKLHPISPRNISAVYSAYKALQRDWRRLPIGGTLTRQW